MKPRPRNFAKSRSRFRYILIAQGGLGPWGVPPPGGGAPGPPGGPPWRGGALEDYYGQKDLLRFIDQKGELLKGIVFEYV